MFVFFIILTGIVAAAHIGKLPPVLLEIMNELTFSRLEGGWIVAAFFLPALIMGLFIGAFSDFIEPQKALLVGLVLLMVGGMIGVLANGLLIMIISRLLEGLGFITIVVSAPALIVKLTVGGRQKLFLGLWGAYMPFGVGIITIFTPILTDFLGWRGLWFGVVFCVIFLFLCFRLIPVSGRLGAPQKIDQISLLRHVKLTISNQGPWLLFGCFFFYAIQWSTIMTWLPSFLIEERGKDILEASFLSAIVVLANVPGNFIGGWLLKKEISRVMLMVFAGAIHVLVSFIIFSNELSDSLRYFGCIIFSAVGGLIPSSLMAAVAVFAPTKSQIGTTNGLMVQGSNMGHFIAPPLVATIVMTSGKWEMNFYFMVLAASFTIIISFLIGSLERKFLTT